MVKNAGHDAGAGRQRQKLPAKADQPARRNGELQTNATFAVRHHVGQLGLAQTQLFHDGALMNVFNINHQLLKWLVNLAVNHFLNNFRARYTQLKPFAAHGLDQNRQVQLAAPGNLEFVCGFTRRNAQRNVVNQLLLQALLDVARSNVLAIQARERRVIDLKGHAHGGLVNGQGHHGFDFVGVTQGVGDAEFVDAGDADDVTRVGFLRIYALQAVIAHYLQHLALALVALVVNDHNLLVGRKAAAVDTAYADDAHITAVVQCRYLHLKRPTRIHIRWLYVADDGFKQRRHVFGQLIRARPGNAVQG